MVEHAKECVEFPADFHKMVIVKAQNCQNSSFES